MPRNQGTSRKGKPGKIEKAAGMGRSLLIKNKYRPRQDGKNIYGGSNGMAAIPGVTSIGIDPNTTTTMMVSGGGGGGHKDTDATTTTTAASRHKLMSTGTHPRSILDMDDLDDFLLQANLAEREFFSDRGGGGNNGGGGGNHPNHIMMMEPLQIVDPSQQHRNSVVHWADDPIAVSSPSPSTTTTVMELSVPRRPPWTSDMSREELEQQEKMAFLEWRRKIAQYESLLLSQSSTVTTTSSSSNNQNTTTTATTPFEKNIHVWKQLWRVMERSNVVIQIIDARNPLFYISYDLYQYVTMELHKPMILLFNKSDYLSKQQRQIWKQYFTTAASTKSGGDDEKKNVDNENDMIAITSPSTPHQQQLLQSSSSSSSSPERHTWTKNCHIIFFSAMREQKKLDVEAAIERKRIIQEQLYQQQQQQQQQEQAALEHEPHETSIFRSNQYSDNDDDDDDDDDDEDDDESSKDDVDDDNVKNIDNDDGDNAHEKEKALTAEDPIDDELHGEDEENDEDDDNDADDVRILTRAGLIETMRSFALEHDCQAEERYDYRIQYGMVGFPNVGKSSVINVLAGASKHTHNTVRVAVASQPGKTKHFQTVLLQDQSDIMLCDCPGLVFPSFVSNTADLIAAGVYPIAQMRDHWPVTNLICQRIPRNILNAHYGIALPVLSHQQLQDRGYDMNNNSKNRNTNDEFPPPSAEELLTTYCIARGLLASFSGVPDYQRAARIIIKDYADGKLLYCHPPPNMTAMELQEFYSYTVQTALRNTQRTRERLLKQQQKLQLQQSTVDGTNNTKKQMNATKRGGTTKQMTALDAFDDDLIQMIAATTMPKTISNQNDNKTDRKISKADETNSHKLHFKKSTGAKWGKKDRKNRNKDPYGCHTAAPDGTILSMI